jgi:hypothetical protein
MENFHIKFTILPEFANIKHSQNHLRDHLQIIRSKSETEQFSVFVWLQNPFLIESIISVNVFVTKRIFLKQKTVPVVQIIPTTYISQLAYSAITNVKRIWNESNICKMERFHFHFAP